jgi:hypothetical protein
MKRLCFSRSLMRCVQRRTVSSPTQYAPSSLTAILISKKANKILMKRLLPVSFLVLLACSWGLQASSVFSPCVSGTVQSYESLSANGGACTIGILVFSGFDFSSAGTDPTLDTAAGITLTPTAGGFTFTQTGPPGTQLQVGLGETAIYNIGWHYFIDPGPRAGGSDLGMDPPFGDATITQFFCNDSSLSQDGPTATPFCSPNTFVALSADVVISSAPQSLFVHNPSPLTAHLDFNPPATQFADVLTSIVLDGTVAPAGFDSVIGTVTIVTDAAPEPSTSFLAFGAVICVGLLGRRMR